MTGNDIVPWLFGVTLLIVLAALIYQYFRVQRSKRLGSPAVPGATDPRERHGERLGTTPPRS
jgi:hypothetical protein